MTGMFIMTAMSCMISMVSIYFFMPSMAIMIHGFIYFNRNQFHSAFRAVTRTRFNNFRVHGAGIFLMDLIGMIMMRMIHDAVFLSCESALQHMAKSRDSQVKYLLNGFFHFTTVHHLVAEIRIADLFG